MESSWPNGRLASCCAVLTSGAYRCGHAVPSRMPRARRRIKNFPDLVAAVIPEDARGKPIELWWQDEACVGQQGTLTRVWAERGSRPRAPRDQRYDWAYLFGAVCPARDAGAALVLPAVDSEAMNLHLAEVSRNVTPAVMPWCYSMAPAGIRLAASSTSRRTSACLSCRPIWEYLRQKPTQQPHLRQLRRHRQRLLQRLEYPHCRARQNPINRRSPLGIG
jgi:hypothetical protein